MAQSIEGSVNEDGGDAIERATVTVTDVATDNQEAKTLTDVSGNYSVSVSASTYDVRAEKPGYEDDVQNDVTVGTNETKTVNLTLSEFQPKVIGRRTSKTSIGVLGETTTGTGAPVALKGSVEAADGWGLLTSAALRIGGFVDTDGDDFVVETGTVLDGNPGNVVFGHASNSVGSNVEGATIAGGGRDDGSNVYPNTVSDDWGTVGGGWGNTAAGAATVAGGDGNTASAFDASIGGGRNNTASELRATVNGGSQHTASERNTTVSGGLQNTAADNSVTVGGGEYNTATSGRASIIAGGTSNSAKAARGTVGGGKQNTIRANDSIIGGGTNNAATSGSTSATISGGVSNAVKAPWGTIGGGKGNTVTGDYATVGGGQANTADGKQATVGGGILNIATSDFAVVVGGTQNRSRAKRATVGGGKKNIAHSKNDTIGGGYTNQTGTSGGSTSLGATIGGGSYNEAYGDDSTIGGGRSNQTGKSGTSLGADATIPGGQQNVATGDHSFAAGLKAEATDDGTFVWSDSTSGSVTSAISDSFIVSAGGGVGINETTPRTQLHVTNKSASSSLESHTALIEDTNNTSARALAVKIGDSSPTSLDHYITFYDADDDYQGAVEGDGSDGVQLDGTTADYGEYMPKRDTSEQIQTADVVGVVNGAITRETDQAAQALVVSDRSIVTGNSPGPDPADRAEYEVCAFVGQVPVKVRGTVDSGDLLVPSGERDGTARAIEPNAYRPGHGPVVGRAWEATDTEAVDRVTVAVGIETGDVLGPALEAQQDQHQSLRDEMATLEVENDRLREQLDAKDDRIESLESETESLRSENEALRERLSAVEGRLGALEAGAADSAIADD